MDYQTEKIKNDNAYIIPLNLTVTIFTENIEDAEKVNSRPPLFLVFI
jgi:hypothetical protein